MKLRRSRRVWNAISLHSKEGFRKRRDTEKECDGNISVCYGPVARVTTVPVTSSDNREPKLNRRERLPNRPLRQIGNSLQRICANTKDRNCTATGDREREAKRSHCKI